MEDRVKYSDRCAHVVKVAFVIVVAWCLCALLGGCKYTDVLTEHIEDPELGVLDETAEPIYVPSPDAPPLTELVDVSIDDVEDINTQEQSIPHYDPNAPDNGPTRRLTKREDTPHDDEAAEGDEESGETNSEQGTGQDDGSQEGTGDKLDDADADDTGGNSDAGGSGGTEAIIDDSGTVSDPSKGTVAAVGYYATITQMLGGSGGLVAADEAWLASIPEGVFPGELANVQAGFAGDGTQEGSAYVDRLINEIKPSVVLWDGQSPALTDSDRAALEAAGINIQAVPHIGEPYTDDDTCIQAVRGVAAVLEGVSTLQNDPARAREAYEGYHQQVLEAVYGANGGYSYKAGDGSGARLYQENANPAFSNAVNTRVTTAYVDGWWQGAPSSIPISQRATTLTGVLSLPNDGKSLDASGGLGTSVAGPEGAPFMVLDYYLQLAGIVNNAYDSDRPAPTQKSYLIMPGRTSQDFGSFTSRSGVDSALWYNAGDASVAANWVELGTDRYPALIARTDEIAQGIAGSANGNGIYWMRNPYQVYVVPSGLLGTWAYGTPESFLVSIWSLRIRDASTLGKAGDAVAQYYKTFYRCDNWSSVVSGWDSAYSAQ